MRAAVGRTYAQTYFPDSLLLADAVDEKIVLIAYALNSSTSF